MRQVRRLLRATAVEWAGPALLALPRDYDRLFTYYHERVCLQCGAVPKEASVCLLCGTLVCLKQPCCRQHQVAEAVQVPRSHHEPPVTHFNCAIFIDYCHKLAFHLDLQKNYVTLHDI